MAISGSINHQIYVARCARRHAERMLESAKQEKDRIKAGHWRGEIDWLAGIISDLSQQRSTERIADPASP